MLQNRIRLILNHRPTLTKSHNSQTLSYTKILLEIFSFVWKSFVYLSTTLSVEYKLRFTVFYSWGQHFSYVYGVLPGLWSFSEEVWSNSHGSVTRSYTSIIF